MANAQGRGGIQGTPKTAAQSVARYKATTPPSKPKKPSSKNTSVSKPKKVKQPAQGMSFATPEQAIQSVVDMMQMKPMKKSLPTEQEVFRNLTRLYGEGEADEKMRAYVAAYPGKMEKTGWGPGAGGTLFRGKM